MKKEDDQNPENRVNRKSYNEWKKRRDVRIRAIPLEVDLENREIFFEHGIGRKLNLEFPTNNIDRLISSLVDPKDSQKVTDSLLLAQKGQEKPITFNIIHPLTAQKLHFEYRYEIVYVKYSSTRLHGVLVNVREPKYRRRPQ